MIYLPKSQPAPNCLAHERQLANGNYNCGNVVARLAEDFLNKCYICEYQEPNTINTEHFVSHHGNVDLKFDWANLFMSCGHCNNVKSSRASFDQILNCTIDHSVETRIKYEMRPFPKEYASIEPQDDSQTTLNTAELLTAVFNGTTIQKKLESANIRSRLLKEILHFQSLLIEFYDPLYSEEERAEVRLNIERQLRPESNFTAFKRWIIRTNETFLADFGGSLPEQ